MRTLSRSDRSVAKDTAPSPPRVCMHVLGVGRTDVRVMREATALVEAGFVVSIVDIEGEVRRPAIEDISGVCIKHVHMPSWYISTRFPWSLFKATQMLIRTTLRVLATSADIYHAHDVPALPACYIAARLRRKLLIFDAHELPLSEMPLSQMSISRRSIHPLLARLFVAMLPHCAGIIASSPSMAREIEKSYAVSDVTSVGNVPLYRAVPKNDRLRQLFGLSSEVRIALYQGYLSPGRWLDLLVRAAPFLEQNIVIVMMGQNVGTTQAELEALIAGEGVADRVKIIPPVPYAELLDWTASADIGLTLFSPDYAPHQKVFLPNKLFEYLMAGLPVLSSPLDAIADILHTYDVGQVVSSLAPADVGAAINAMLADQVALDRMHRNALQAAQHEFYWEKERSRLIDLYHHILGARSTKYEMQETPAHDKPPSALES